MNLHREKSDAPGLTSPLKMKSRIYMLHQYGPSRLTPWIESLILSYGGPEDGRRGRLKAHVIGLDQMTQSQARGCEGPTELLVLSDGLIWIPAVLTASAWENLQEREDREYFNGMINSTVLIQDYRLQFHMDTEQNKCWFYLSVGELGTIAAGPVKELTPCYTSLSSVRMKIRETWQSLLVQENFHWSQCELDLTQLLEAWQDDCLQEVLDDIRKRLTAADSPPGRHQPSTSAHRAADTWLRTGWDVDRVRYKGEESFTVPARCLLIPEEDSQQVEVPAGTGGEAHPATEADPPQAPGWDAGESSPVPEDSLLHELILSDSDDLSLSNPWDVFPPLDVRSLSSDSSREMTPTPPECGAAAASHPDAAAMVTSTQLPVHSYLPPYQKQPTALPSSSTTSTNPPQPPSSDDTAQQNLLRKRCDVTAEPGVPGQEELSESPPSWLFDLTGTSRTEEPVTPSTEPGPRKILNTHGDGKPFTYTYKVCGQNLQDLSRFRVAASLLHWAVKYLVTPRQKDPPAHAWGS
uniref:Shelterin complex subunit TPP1/Est3 domain-containing protein n=1 Tax=Oryzias latipes TaxID=8090 RepID=A0A3B3HX10_ORYLA